jgi:TMEM175 potassium channel family protein
MTAKSKPAPKAMLRSRTNSLDRSVRDSALLVHWRRQQACRTDSDLYADRAAVQLVTGLPAGRQPASKATVGQIPDRMSSVAVQRQAHPRVPVDNGGASRTNRTEAFSDGVLAIAITLLVLNLHVPLRETLHGSLAAALAREWPAYASYVTSFLVIGIIWVNHHTVFELIGRIDRIALFLNLLLLMSVVAIPFTTALLAEYLLAGGNSARTAALVYSAVMLTMSFAFAALYTYVARRPALLADGVDPTAIRQSIVRFSAVGTLLYTATIVVALFSAPLCLVLHFLIALYYGFQQIRPGRRPLRHEPG